MAQLNVIKADHDGIVSAYPGRWLALTGAGVGLFVSLASLFLEYYVTDPLFCRSLTTSGFCVRSDTIAFGVATILGVIVGVFGLVRSSASRPLLVAVAAAVSLWPAYGWVSGLNLLSSILFIVLLYVIAYLLFAWITRIVRSWLAVLVLGLSVFLLYLIGR